MKPVNLNISRGGIGGPNALRQDWYTEILDDKLDVNLSGIYEWRITDLGLYIGQAKKLAERIGAYPRNLRCMLEGKSWHGVLTEGDPLQTYRPVHRALFEAYHSNLRVSVAVLENCAPGLLSERERWWIGRRRDEALVGGLPVLNSSGRSSDRSEVVRTRRKFDSAVPSRAKI